ncbi:MAG: hypothetical protein OIN85_01545 [Candidatus Methanoperedens sp.]|nr:hypothetical protein [Candidatus Methanoperedens sp.]
MAEVERMRYFDGLFLKQEEFNLEQNYHIRMRRLHNRHLHTQGIVWGLDVKVVSGKVVVGPGMAINAVGGSQDEGNENEDISQEIVLADPVSLSLSASEVQNGVYIYIYFKKEAADEVPDRGGTEKIHWAEKALIDRDPSRSNSENEGKIILARVQNSSGTIDDAHIFYTDKDGTTPLRTYAGAYGKLTLSIENETYEPLIEGKKIGGKNGILVTSELTKFSGALSLKGGITGGLHIGGDSDPGDKNLVVDGDCTIYGNLDVRGDTTSIETKTLEVEDNVVVVNKYPPQPAPKTLNGGLEVFRGGSVKNAQIIWDETADKWKIGLDGNLADVAYGANWVSLTDNSVANTLHRHSKIVSADGLVDPALNVDNSGNVGIGTGPKDAENAESWGKVLDIVGPKSVKLSVRTAGIDARVLAHDSGWWGAPAGMIIGTNTAHPLSFGTGSAVRMTIDGSGRVCIGTSAAARKLQVDGDVLINAGSPAGNAGLEILGTSGSFGPSVGLNNGKQEWKIVSWDDNSLKFVKATGTTFTPFTINNTSFQDALVLAANGVGVGTAAPSEKLEVNGRIKAAAFIGDGSLITNLPIGQWFINTKGIYYDKGYVGIGTSSPGANLEVKSGASIFRASDLAPDDFIKINATNEILTIVEPPIVQPPIIQPIQPPIIQPIQPPIIQPIQPPIVQPIQPPIIQPIQPPIIQPIQPPISVTPLRMTATPVRSTATIAGQPTVSAAAASVIGSIGTIGTIGTTVAGGPTIQFFEANAMKANLWWQRGGAFLINSIGSTNTSINPSGGNVGIGTASPTHKFHVMAADAVGLFESTGTQAYLRLSTSEGLDNRVEITNRPGGRLSLWTAGAGDVFNITRDGNVGIGRTDPQQKLHVAGNISVDGTRTYLNGLDAGVHWIMAGGAVEGTNNAIGLNPGKKLFSVAPGWSKAFMAHHPLDPENKYLTHSTLEGPENAVFYRGEAELSGGRTTIQLPDYFEALTRKENRTVLITPKFEGDSQVSMLAASEVDDGKFDVKMIDRKNPSQKFYWEVKAVRADVGILDVEEQKLPAQ